MLCLVKVTGSEEELRVEMCVDEQNLEQLVSLISMNVISNIGAKVGYFEQNPEFTLQFVHFDVEDGKKVNPRIQEGHLLLDLWFHSHNSHLAPGVLEERTRFHREGFQTDVLLTVVITDLDYISFSDERYYW